MRLNFIILIVFTFLSEAYAEEYGVAIVGVATPHYMGAGEHYPLLFPIPLFSSSFKKEAKATSAFDFHFDFNLPISGDSSDASKPNGYLEKDEYILDFKNYARRGMGFTPAVLFVGGEAAFSFDKLEFVLSAAPGVQLGKDWSGVGVLSKIELTWHALRWGSLEFIFVGATKFSSANYNQLYYGVERAEVISGREYYKAEAGYLGSSLAFHFHTWVPIKSMIFGFFLEYQTMENSVVENSPLVVRPYSFQCGGGFGFLF